MNRYQKAFGHVPDNPSVEERALGIPNRATIEKSNPQTMKAKSVKPVHSTPGILRFAGIAAAVVILSVITGTVLWFAGGGESGPPFGATETTKPSPDSLTTPSPSSDRGSISLPEETPAVTLLPSGEEFTFTGFGEKPGTIVEYGNNRVFSYGLCEVADGVLYQSNMYKSSAKNDGKLYAVTAGTEELLVDAEVRNLVYHDGKLYYIKKMHDDIYPGSVSVIGNIHAFNIETMEEELVLEANAREFRLTDKGIFLMTPGGLFLADYQGNTLVQYSDQPSGSFYLYARYAVLMDTEKEQRYFLDTVVGTKTYIDHSLHGIWEDTLFYSNDNGVFIELNLITGEEKSYDVPIHRNTLYMTQAKGELYVTDMQKLYKLDREKLQLVPLEYDYAGGQISLFSLNDLFTDGEKLYAPCSYSEVENGAAVYNIAVFDISGGDKAVLSMLLP